MTAWPSIITLPDYFLLCATYSIYQRHNATIIFYYLRRNNKIIYHFLLHKLYRYYSISNLCSNIRDSRQIRTLFVSQLAWPTSFSLFMSLSPYRHSHLSIFKHNIYKDIWYHSLWKFISYAYPTYAGARVILVWLYHFDVII